MPGDEAVQRVFFAVELGASVRAAALAVIEELQRRDGHEHVRWVRPEALHVTLRFLGNVETGRLDGLARAVAKETGEVAPFGLGLGAVIAFPTPRRPRVVAAEVSPAGPLSRAAAAIERGVVAAGFAPETRPFRGHLTLGRVKGSRAPRLAGLAALEVPEHVPTPIAHAVLFASELRPEGARYTPLERVPLGGTNDPEPRL